MRPRRFVADHQRDSDRLAQGPADSERHGCSDTGASRRPHHFADDLPARGAALAVTIAQRSWRALELTKLALRAHRKDTTNFDTAAQALLFDSADKYERMTTFLERKKA